MCGIFGVISPQVKNNAEFYHFISQLMHASKSRGTDATGFASLASGEFLTDKKPVSAEWFSRLSFEWRKHMYVDNLSLIGHTRAATAGAPSDNRNNHPFHGSRYTIAHNGGIWGHKGVAAEHGFNLESACDSELILHFLENGNTLREGIVDALAHLDSISMMAVCILERDTGNVHLFRTESSPCTIFKFPRWNTVAFASTPRIMKLAASNVLGTFDRVGELSELPYRSGKNQDGDIPSYHHVTITPNGDITHEDLSDEIAEKTGTKQRGRYAGYKNALDVSAFNHGKSTYRSEKSYSTIGKSICSGCRRVYDTPSVGVEHKCECGTMTTIVDTGKESNLSDSYSSTEWDTTSDDDTGHLPIWSDDWDNGDRFDTSGDVVYSILPYSLMKLSSDAILDSLNVIRSPRDGEDRYDMSETDMSNFISLNLGNVRDKLLMWSDMSLGRIENMEDGEYLAYYVFVEELLSDMESMF